ncbi:MAG: hypothetical protein SFY80_15130 [Verrucomicrobiota bacterium]|nr:hypothetical protein [Verrucomicrobiota bacterium]
MKILVCEEVEFLSDEDIAHFKRLIAQVEREQNETRSLRELARNFHLGKLITQSCKDIEAEWHLQEEIKLVQRVSAHFTGKDRKIYLKMANLFRTREYTAKGSALFISHTLDDAKKSEIAKEIRELMNTQLSVVNEMSPELAGVVESMLTDDEDALLNLRRAPIAALWKNAAKGLIPESNPEVYAEIQATQKRMKELNKEFEHLHARMNQRRKRCDDLLKPIAAREPMVGILALHPLYSEFTNPFLRYYYAKPVKLGKHYPDIAVSRPEVWQYLFNKINEQKPMSDEEHRQAIDFIINWHRKLGRPAPHLSPAAVYFIQKIRPFAEQSLNGKPPTFDRAFWASLQTREERTYCLAREFAIALDKQCFELTWDRKRFLDLLPESEIPQIIEACFQAHREKNSPRKEIHWKTYNDKIEDELTRPEPFKLAIPDMTEEAPEPTVLDAEVDEGKELEVIPRWDWVYCIHPHNPTNKPIRFDPQDADTLAETLNQAKQNAVIKVSSIASAIQLYEEMDSSIRQLLPQENIDGIEWHKLKRGSMRILLRGPEGSRPARAHIYDRKDYEWREMN